MGMYETQQRQKVEGLKHRKAQREAIAQFVAEFKAEHKREPTYEEIAVHFDRSRSWVWLLKRSAVTDAKAWARGVV